jgi:hypothetical protein
MSCNSTLNTTELPETGNEITHAKIELTLQFLHSNMTKLEYLNNVNLSHEILYQCRSCAFELNYTSDCTPITYGWISRVVLYSPGFPFLSLVTPTPSPSVEITPSPSVLVTLFPSTSPMLPPVKEEDSFVATLKSLNFILLLGATVLTTIGCVCFIRKVYTKFMRPESVKHYEDDSGLLIHVKRGMCCIRSHSDVDRNKAGSDSTDEQASGYFEKPEHDYPDYPLQVFDSEI